MRKQVKKRKKNKFDSNISFADNWENGATDREGKTEKSSRGLVWEGWCVKL